MESDVNDRNLFVLGRRRSGKSMFSLGLFNQLLDTVGKNGKINFINHALQRDIKELNNTRNQWPSPAEPTDITSYIPYIVEYSISGAKSRLASAQYSGAHIPDNRIISAIGQTDRSIVGERIPSEPKHNLSNEEVISYLTNSIESCDVLILILDGGDLIEYLDTNLSNTYRIFSSIPSSLYVSFYEKVLAELVSRPDLIIPVATRCDLLTENFKTTENLENIPENHDLFKSYVNDILRDHLALSGLLNYADTEIHPVYYDTKVAEEYHLRIPDMSGDISPKTVGISEIMTKVGLP